MAGVVLEHVTKTFRKKGGQVCAVDDLSLAVADREFVVLVGPSGCGKTTILRLIAGLEEPTHGTIRIGEAVVNDVAPKDRDIAMVFQNYALYPHMTVQRNLAFGLKMRRVPKEEVKRKVADVAARLGLDDVLERKPGTLSGGQRQRVALGRAIVRTPRVFLLDEPLANLDASLRLRMRTEIKTLHRELQTTVIYVTHDQEEAMTMGDRIVVLRRGVVQQAGPPLEVYDRPANRFVAGFVGTPPMNFLDGRLEVDEGTVAFVCGLGRLALPRLSAPGLQSHVGRPMVLGIRPEHLRLGQAGVDSGEGATGEPRPVSLGELSVRAAEPLGSTVNVHLMATTGETLVARMASSVRISAADRVHVFADLSRAHVFPAGTCGERLVCDQP